jgi:hypothetical protein
MKLLPEGRKRIRITETGHSLEVVNIGSTVGKEERHDVENRMLNCLRFNAVQITVIWR